jgi:polar amino acid transport system permease protein
MRWDTRRRNRHYAKVWDTSFKKVLIVNIIWLALNIPVSIILNFLLIENIFIDVINTTLNILTGTIVVILLYRKNLKESFFFIVIIQLIVLIASLVLGVALTFILGFFMGQYYEIAFYILRMGVPFNFLLIGLGLLIGTYVMRWYVGRKNSLYAKVWDTSFKKALIVNIIWLALNIPVSIILNFILVENIFIGFINTVLNILTGTIVVMQLYKKKFKESFFFIIIIQLIVLIASFVVGIAFTFIIGFFMGQYYEIAFYILRIGLPFTLLLTGLGLSIGFVLGMALALMRVYGGIELGWVSSVYEKIFRGIPILVLIYIFAFGLSGLFWFVEPLQRPLASIVLALALRSGAYQSQIFRGAILSVNPGQEDAARALGMSRGQSFRHIIFPQAMRLAVPSWSNEYAVVIKDSSFAYAVGIVELTKAAYDYSVAFKGTWTLSIGILAILYFLLTFPVTKLFGERQTKKLKNLGMGGN